jgi:hemin uptake protein HemP
MQVIVSIPKAAILAIARATLELRVIAGIKNPADEAGFFVGCRGKTIHLCRTAFDQPIRTTFGNAIFDQTIRTISSHAILDQPIRTISSHAILDQPIRTISSYTILDQPIRTISSYTILDQPIRTPLSHTTLNQPIRAALSDNRVSGGSGESVHCKNRESEAEKDLAFHDCVLRGVGVWYGGDVTPRSF